MDAWEILIHTLLSDRITRIIRLIMEINGILNEIKGIFIELFKTDNIDINEKTSPENISEWDSLHHVLLIAAIEKRYKIKFELSDMLSIRSIGDICTCIIKKLETDE